MTHIDIVFDGPPGHESGRFVEVEDASGRSINAGEWLQRKDGYWVLRLTGKDAADEKAGITQASDSLSPPEGGKP